MGAKPSLRPSHFWSTRTKLQIEGKKRDLALFSFAIDSKLRGCDVVAVRVDDVAPSGYAIDRATIRQKPQQADAVGGALRATDFSKFEDSSGTTPIFSPHLEDGDSRSVLALLDLCARPCACSGTASRRQADICCDRHGEDSGLRLEWDGEPA